VFGRWGAFVYRFRRVVVVLAVAAALLSVRWASQASAELDSGGWLDNSSPSAQVADRLAADFSTGRSSLLVLYRGAAGASATSPAFQAGIAASLSRLGSDPRVAGTVGYAQTHSSRFISSDGRDAYVVVELAATDEQSVAQLPSLRAEITTPPGTEVQLTGYAPITVESAQQSEQDLQRAETVSLPLALLILIGVFGSVVAAGLPLLVAGLTIPTTLAFVYLLAQHTQMSVFVLNVSTMLGLALAIDYSLFLVSRFREELARGRTVAEAVESAVATSGKAVAFSGSTVAIGLLGLMTLKAPALGSIGIGGALVVLFAVVYGLTFLPAVLGMLGPRVNALSVSGAWRRLRGMPPPPVGASAADPGGRWRRMARWVMRHPLLVFVPVLALLLLAGTPLLRMQEGVPGASIYPPGMPSRDAAVTIARQFPAGETTPIQVLADVPGDPASPANARALAAYAARLSAVPGVTRVESPFSGLVDPATGRAMTPDQIAAVWSLPVSRRPAQLAAASAAYIRGSTVQLDLISPLDPSTPAATAMIPTIRAIDPGDGIRVQVGGVAATGYDFLASMDRSLPTLVIVVIGAMLAILFLLFGSVVLPVKAVAMTLLSISASFGALVWVFQDGNLSNVLHFEVLGYTIAGDPVIMFCLLFGLSMDYEVLMLSRMQEAWRRNNDNTAAVEEGLVRTASVITGAALIMVSVFAAFALAKIITIQSLGVGMAIAVLVDATVIRVLLVPATMRLLGRWNWWAPGPLARLAEHLGFGELEGDGTFPAAGPRTARGISPD